MLQQVFFDFNEINDITPLAGLVHLNRIRANSNKIERIEVLLRIPNLVSVDLRNNPLSEFLDVFEKLNQSNIRVDY